MRSGCNGRGVGGVVVPVGAVPYDEFGGPPPSCSCCRSDVVAATARTGVLLLPLLMLALAFMWLFVSCASYLYRSYHHHGRKAGMQTVACAEG